jgi:anthranilate phosphoribosyltransferase
MIPVVAPEGAIDVCGTGGDGSHSLNVSTAVAIVVAACGVPVAKHGNRAASSSAGAPTRSRRSASISTAPPAIAEQTLADFGIAFLFAQKHHPHSAASPGSAARSAAAPSSTSSARSAIRRASPAS